MRGELDVAKQAALGLQQELNSMRQHCSDLEKKVLVVTTNGSALDDDGSPVCFLRWDPD